MNKFRTYEVAQSNYEPHSTLVKRRYDGFIFDEHLRKSLEEGSWISFKVIEYSAFEKLQRENQILREALERIHGMVNINRVEGPHVQLKAAEKTYASVIAREALKAADAVGDK